MKVVCCSRRHQGRCRWKALPREIHERCSRPTRHPRDRGGSCWTYATDVFNSPRHPPATEPPLPLRVPPTLPEYADTSLLLTAKSLLATSGFWYLLEHIHIYTLLKLSSIRISIPAWPTSRDTLHIRDLWRTICLDTSSVQASQVCGAIITDHFKH